MLQIYLNEPRVIAHPAAHQCLQHIVVELTHQSNSLTRWQTDINKSLATLSALAQTFAVRPDQTLHRDMTTALKTYNSLFMTFATPVNRIDFAQVPTRLVLTADNLLKQIQEGKPQNVSAARREFVSQMVAINSLRI